MLVLTAAALAIAPLVRPLAAQQGAPGGPRQMINLPTDPLLRGFRWRSIGPVAQGGRIDDFAVDEKNPSTYYIGFAVGGVYKTINNGTTFEPIFETYGSASIADLALAPSDPNILYVATGEANNRQTTSYGDGMYKSTDAGKTFTNIGLRDSQTLGRTIVHPKDPNTVWVAVGGHLYGPNPDRGVFMTTDGGKTWQKTLFLGPSVGATDLIIDPSNPLNLWVTMYEHQRTAWGYSGGGPASGIYASVDGGKKWTKLAGNGLPHGTLGRIALDICKTQPNVIYAQIEVAPDKEPQTPLDAPAAPAGQGGGGRGGRGGRGGAGGAAAGGAGAGGGGGQGGAIQQPPDPQSSGVWKSVDKGKTWTFQSNQNARPMYFSQIRVDPNDPTIVYTGGVSAYKSTDSGKTWSELNGKGHVDNHAIWIDPLNSKHVMYGDDGALDVSWDGGDTWEAVRLWPVGLAYHVSADLRRPYWVCTGLQDNGSWCGPSSTRSGGIHEWNWISVGGGDGFQNQIDPTDPSIFYTESQNAGIQRYNLSTGQTQSIKPNLPGGGGRGGGGGGGGGGRGGGAGAAGAGAAGGGAGAAAGAAGGEETLAAQAGGGGGRSNVLNTPPQDTISQFNWNSPIRLSPHNSSTVLLGGRQLFISRDRGQTWTITQSLGKGIDLNQRTLLEQSYSLPGCGRGSRGTPCILSKNDGYVANEFGSMTELAESPILPGVIWAGTDDGNVQVSKDGGNTFTEVGKNIPGVNHEYYVSGLEASWYDAGTAYVALDGHRHDDLKPYIFKTTNYGQTWTSVSGNLPAFGNVNSIRQDPVNRNLLFAPTELGFYISLDDGKTWSRFMPNLPVARVDEVLVHPREHDLILATHSHSVWILDDITALEQISSPTALTDAQLFKPREAVLWKPDQSLGARAFGDKWWSGEVAPRGTAIAYYLKSDATDVKVTITNTATGQPVHTCIGATTAGLNRFQWAFTTDPGAGGGGGGGGFGGGGGGGGRGGRGGAAAAGAPNAPAAPAAPEPCSAGGGGGGGRGGGGGGGGRGGGGGGVPAGVYRVTLSVGGREVGSQTFNVVEDVWLGEK